MTEAKCINTLRSKGDLKLDINRKTLKLVEPEDRQWDIGIKAWGKIDSLLKYHGYTWK